MIQVLTHSGTKRVNQIVHCYSDNASTEPILCVLNDGTQAVVKYPNNLEGNLTLINEYLAFRIASQVGLDIPGCGICELDEAHSVSEEFSQYLKCEDCSFSECNYGTCFYSSFVERIVPLTFGIVPYVTNKENFYTMVLFDHLVYNKDRHRGNLLICTDKPVRYFAIDHSHIFKHEAIWDRYQFAQGVAAKDYLDKTILEYNDEVYSYFFSCMDINEQLLYNVCLSMKKELTADFYHRIITDIPPEWCKGDMLKDFEALESYLCYRTEHLEEIANLIIEERRNQSGH